MKSTVVNHAPPAVFKPIAVSIILESQEEAEAFRTMVSRNVTIPKLVTEKFYGTGDAVRAGRTVYDLLGNLQAQLDAQGFTYPVRRKGRA